MKPIKDRDALIAALQDAANLEHQLMVQYLYAGFSLKRGPDEHCTPAQYEAVRRWSSTIFMIARQEMEHLSFANSMLTAIGASPHFSRTNIGEQGLLSPYFASATLARATTGKQRKPVSLPYTFAPFDRATIERFICGESPPYDELPAGVNVDWCFTCANASQAEPGALQAQAALEDGPDTIPREESRLAQHFDGLLAAAGDGKQPGFEAGSVQELYLAIKAAFEKLDGIFAPGPPEVDIPVEYNVFTFPVTDRTTAAAAIDLILEQGEGLGDPWNLEAHFRRFCEIRDEYLELKDAAEHRGNTFEPAYPLLTNPGPEKITNDFTHAVFDVTNDAYVVLLLILTSLYRFGVPAAKDNYPYLSTALSQNAFAPGMTMILRALNEILVLLPIDAGGDTRTSSNYFIGPEDFARLERPQDACFGDIGFLLGRWERMTESIGALAERAKTEAHKVKPAPNTRPRGIADELHYVYESAYRTGANLRQTYQYGLYDKFKV